MIALRIRNLKFFTLALSLFAVTVMPFVLNYTQNVGDVRWHPEKVFGRISEQMKKWIKSTWRPCSCNRCVSELNTSLWFDKRFNQSVSPLLTKSSNWIPADTYQWWMKLQSERKPKNINEMLTELFDLIPGENDFPAPDPFQCRRCAVVGNSGNLKNSNYGSIIDSHNFIMRMNRAITARFETDVGSRTTHHFMYPESYTKLAQNVSMILVPFKTLDLQWVVSALTTGAINHTYVSVPKKIDIGKEKILIYNPAFMKYVFEIWMDKHGRYPSTGILAVIFALHMCDEVNVFGFGADTNGNWHHYWENNSLAGAFRKTGVHDADFQSDVTKKLSSINKIHFFMGR
uniref:CMP-N-acetylneuraminate-beta-galactosamide-alpha-2,3-sialyltransferase 1 n=1 Tax=Geotrypetes seraphini TaxID=260995 RepID=A0A6P8QRJ1_GEOSA|nr:CMP-N-acetylneuraminate-beta-galactosamide-alpha-2,3-sialyltransferase 1 [Geotrypetes seraphini]XP_033789192.1 CMP-N-acetylneuraminate-beta-galactosamide-alpha-2,3-sialyltransferase 1 [Geotrypetes seraphini]XP_033789193.1 CMP-N-acetylneuraminate-beta-galactosamide-alpha-2,3-sialyltransferase 1 [Geotrypetes seraphini]